MVNVGRETLLKQRKLLELALQELESGSARPTRRSRLALGDIDGLPLDTAEQRISSIKKRIAQIDEHFKRRDL